MSTKPLFVLICDRSKGYFSMTIQAIRCLRKHTKTVPIGVIFPAGSGDLTDNKNAVLDALKTIDPKLDQSNFYFKEGTNHFENWNPTQHKLDMELFAKEFDPIIWLDSDTVVLKDLAPFINTFVSTGKRFAFLADHVNNDPGFKKNWEGPLFVPQACYMIFRSKYIPEFFKIWEDTWKEWITPYPFQRHKDPAPHFNNSFFCIEQYALGQSIFKYVKEADFDKEVHRIDRSQLFIGRNVAVDTQKIKEEFQSRSAARPSALAHAPHVDKDGVTQRALYLDQKSPKSVPKSPQYTAVAVVSPQSSTPADSDSFPAPPISLNEPPAATATTTTYAPEPASGDEAGFIVTATYTTAPGAFQADGLVSTSSSSSYPVAGGESQSLVSGPSSYTTSYAPSSYVSSYLIPSSYPTSYSRVTSYTTSYTAGVTTSYGASAATSYSASAATSYSASAATSYGASGTTSYGATTSYGGATSYASSYASSYPTSGSYGYVSSLSSSAGLSTFYTEDGGLPLTNYGNLSLQFSLPGEGGSADTASSSMYVYGALDSNVYFLTTNAALASSSQATNLSNSNNEFYMVDLIQDNSIAHYYNANQGVNSGFVADHGTVVANTINQIKTKAGKSPSVPELVKVYTPPPAEQAPPAAAVAKKGGKK